MEHREFDLETDNQVLSWVLAHPRNTGHIARWAVRIFAFSFKVKHIQSSDNGIADALSGMFEEKEDPVPYDGDRSNSVAGILAEIPQLFCELRYKQEHDPQLDSLCNSLRRGEKIKGYALCKGILCKEVGCDKHLQICLPRELVSPAFYYFHNSLAGGHLGVHKTIRIIKAHVIWPNPFVDVCRLVGEYCLCSLAKPQTGAKMSLLYLHFCLLIPASWFVCICCDITT